MPKQSDDLSREGDESQETEKAGIKIPVPKKREFDRLLNRATDKKEKKAKRRR